MVPLRSLEELGSNPTSSKLPPRLHVHNNFHVSLLKEYVPDPLHLLNDEDTILVNQEEFQMTPEQILKIKERNLRRRTIREALVLWKGYPLEDASWEDWDHHVTRFFLFS